MHKTAFRGANYLYRHQSSLYRFFYFAYKSIKDADEKKFIRRTVSRGMTVVDIGANIGFYSRFLSALVGSEGELHAFEPDVSNFDYLKRTLDRSGNTVLCQMAVAGCSGVLGFYPSPDMNVDHASYKVEGRQEQVSVKCVSLDDYFPSGKKVDFIKMDIQGFEFEAWKGMKRIIAENPQMVILSEFYPWGLRRAGADPADYLRAVYASGLQAFTLKGSGLEKVSAETDFPSEEGACWNMVFSRKHYNKNP